VIDLLHRAGVEGATALLGVDGTAAGVRRRARFFSANAEVPVMVISVGKAESIAAAVSELTAVLARPVMTIERIRVLRRDGRQLAEPAAIPAFDSKGRMQWRKLMVYSREHGCDRGAQLHLSLIRALRREGAAGATMLRGIWGYHGDHAPHGDTLWSLRRDAPVVTVVVDAPAPMERWLEVVAEHTAHAGLVTSEIVPAFRATGPGIEHGGLALADHWRD
jgi:PII-like signaling protein